MWGIMAGCSFPDRTGAGFEWVKFMGFIPVTFTERHPTENNGRLMPTGFDCQAEAIFLLAGCCYTRQPLPGMTLGCTRPAGAIVVWKR
jgi:hypothetical protein